MGAAQVRAGGRAWMRVHPDLTELAFGAASAAALLLISFWQWGINEDAATRGLSIGLLLGLLVTYSYRRRRRADEQREQALVEHRLRLARELHDAVAGQVAVIGIQAAAARRVLASQPDQAAIALERIETASRAAVADLRGMLVALRAEGQPPAALLPEPGLLQIDRLVADAAESGVNVTVEVEGSRPTDLAPAVDAAAFRIVGESLTNVLKHAPASSANVLVRFDAHHVVLKIRNGPGTRSPISGASTGGGLGITGMQERARLLGGTVTSGPTPDGGWLVTARLPLR